MSSLDKLVVVRREATSSDTRQSDGMARREAISQLACGSQAIWMGETVMAPHSVSASHHHGKSETGIYVVAGHPEFVFRDEGSEVRLATGAGDYVYVPPMVAHREENPGDQPAIVVVARTSGAAIVVNLDDL